MKQTPDRHFPRGLTHRQRWLALMVVCLGVLMTSSRLALDLSGQPAVSSAKFAPIALERPRIWRKPLETLKFLVIYAFSPCLIYIVNY